MTPQYAIEVLERAKSMLDTAVYHHGSFSTHVQYEQAKDQRAEYKAAVRTLKKLVEKEGV